MEPPAPVGTRLWESGRRPLSAKTAARSGLHFFTSTRRAAKIPFRPTEDFRIFKPAKRTTMNLAQDYFSLVEDYEAGNAPFPFVPMFDHFDDSESVAEELAETWKASRIKGKRDSTLITDALSLWQDDASLREKFPAFPSALLLEIARTRITDDIQLKGIASVLSGMGPSEVIACVNEFLQNPSFIHLITRKSYMDSYRDAEQTKTQKENEEEKRIALLMDKAEEHKRFFESFERRYRERIGEPLSFSDNQKCAIVLEEPRCLLTSSAGSGKTAVLIAHYFYLVEECGMDPKKILLLVYTKQVCNEINEKIKLLWLEKGNFDLVWPENSAPAGKLPGPAKTFHSLALEVIRSKINITPKILTEDTDRNSEDDDNSAKLFLQEMVKSDKSLLQKFEEVAEKEGVYIQIRNRFSTAAPKNKKDVSIGNAYVTKSSHEEWIRQFYREAGIWAEYERSDGKYKPDFTLRRDGQVFVHEHFATLRRDPSDPSFANYAEHAEEKIQYFTSKYGNNFFYTCGEDAYGNRITKDQLLRTLKKELEQRGFSTNPKDDLEESIIIEMIHTYVDRFFTLRPLIVERKENLDRLTSNMKNMGEYPFLFWTNIYLPLDRLYRNELRNEEYNATDFVDCIDWAQGILKEYKTDSINTFRYSAILIDEYQDITSGRHAFLKTLTDQDENHTHLYAVGDDWQSIYSFTGSDLSLFRNFTKRWKNGTMFNLGETFRFGEPLVGISGKFVLADNPSLLPRKVSGKGNTRLILCPIRFSEKDYDETYWSHRRKCNEDQLEVIRKRLRRLSSDEDGHEKKRIAVLSRYNNTWQDISGQLKNLTEEFKWIKSGGDLAFSMHKAKGITVDYAFVISCNDGVIPSEVQDDIIVEAVKTAMWRPGDEDNRENEERRLFYVAITRARKATFLLYDVNRPSKFIEEMKRMEGVEVPE